MPKADKQTIDIFDKLKRITEADLREREDGQIKVRTAMEFLTTLTNYNPDSTDNINIAIIRVFQDILNSEVAHLRQQVSILDATSRLFNQVFEELDLLKDALQNIGADVNEVKSVVKNREEIFSRIDEIIEEMAEQQKTWQEEHR